jgi:hypothetical protein
MRIKFLLSAICFVFILPSILLSPDGQASSDLETGAAGTAYYNVLITGNKGTFFN